MLFFFPVTSIATFSVGRRHAVGCGHSWVVVFSWIIASSLFGCWFALELTHFLFLFFHCIFQFLDPF
jgi:hypothetical protein